MMDPPNDAYTPTPRLPRAHSAPRLALDMDFRSQLQNRDPEGGREFDPLSAPNLSPAPLSSLSIPDYASFPDADTGYSQSIYTETVPTPSTDVRAYSDFGSNTSTATTDAGIRSLSSSFVTVAGQPDDLDIASAVSFALLGALSQQQHDPDTSISTSSSISADESGLTSDSFIFIDDCDLVSPIDNAQLHQFTPTVLGAAAQIAHPVRGRDARPRAAQPAYDDGEAGAGDALGAVGRGLDVPRPQCALGRRPQHQDGAPHAHHLARYARAPQGDAQHRRALGPDPRSGAREAPRRHARVADEFGKDGEPLRGRTLGRGRGGRWVQHEPEPEPELEWEPEMNFMPEDENDYDNGQWEEDLSSPLMLPFDHDLETIDPISAKAQRDEERRRSMGTVAPGVPPLGPFAAMDALTAVVLADMGKNVVACDVVAQDEWRKTCDVMLEDGTEVVVMVYSASMPKSVVETEMATMSFVKANTTIPIQKVLHSSAYNSRALGPYAILEKVQDGVRLDQVFETLPEFEQDLIVMQWARWTSELCSPSFRLPKIGSLAGGTDAHGTPNMGPLLHLPFFRQGRAAMPQLDRGPWASAHEYRLACAQRELECARALFTQGLELSESYRRSVEDGQLRAEKAAALVMGIADAVKDMDEKDPELACFALDLHELGLRNILVDAYDATRVLAVTDWHRITSRPLWRCAQIPRWIANSSLSSTTKNVDHARLENVFRAMLRADKCPLMRALEQTAADGSDARLALDDACDYDAVADGFLVLPALQSIAATLPGQEDTEGFAALLDPHTIAGRALRVNLVTKSFGAIAFTPPETTRMSQLDSAHQERTTGSVLPSVKSAGG